MSGSASPPTQLGGPALALVEVASIARGHRVADAMVKRAPVELLRVEPVSPGKLLVLVAGDVASVDEAFRAGLEVAGDAKLDALFLPNAHEQLPGAVRGEARAGDAAQRETIDALAVVETTTVAATILAADAAAKAARVRLIEMQLARGIGGKAFFVLTGALEEIEAAVEAALGAIDAAAVCGTEIIAAPHGDLVARLR